MDEFDKRIPLYRSFNMSIRDKCFGRGFDFESAFAAYQAGWFSAKKKCGETSIDEDRFLDLLKMGEMPSADPALDKVLEQKIAVKLLDDGLNKRHI